MTDKSNELVFLPLGGSNEIGMNFNAYGFGPAHDRKWIIVDVGVTFGDLTTPGVDIIVPDPMALEGETILGIVLTHAHEDHIGGLAWLWPRLKAPLYATPFTGYLVREKLRDAGIDDAPIHIVPVGGAIDLGPFRIEMVTMTHSIAEPSGLAIKTPLGTVFHTGDWKLDEEPLLGTPSTAGELEVIGDKGVLALVCDSTNVFNDEASGSEAAVREGLDAVISEATGRVLVTTFASNAARLQTLGQVAQDTGRRICVAGRSLDRIIRVAKSVGYLKDFPEPIDFDLAMDLPPREVLIVATGGQGEARAALGRIAFDQHPLKVGEGDLVVFSSKQIPGNEIAIGRIQNALAVKGVKMITDRQAHVHVSGHPGRPELALMYKWTRPQIILPVHGEMRHMAEQARFATEQGVPQAVVQQNGTVVRLAPGEPKAVGQERAGRLIVDGDVILPADGSTINERRRIAAFGQISVALALDGQGRVRGTPEVRLQGIPVEEDKDDFIAEACEAAGQAARKGDKDDAKLREAIRLAVRRKAVEWTGKKPIVDVLLVRV